jgi:hypothetical protein
VGLYCVLVGLRLLVAGLRLLVAGLRLIVVGLRLIVVGLPDPLVGLSLTPSSWVTSHFSWSGYLSLPLVRLRLTLVGLL